MEPSVASDALERMLGEPRQILSLDGQLHGESPVEDSELLEIYRAMLRARVVDDRCYALQRQGRLPAYYQASGQEATIASVFAIRPEDWVLPAYREPGVYLARGLPVRTVMAIWKGAVDDGWTIQSARMPRIAGTVGTHLPHATGISYASRILGIDDLAIALFGDGATSTADFHAALNFAGVWNAPTIFLCQNNQYAQSTPLARQTRSATLAVKAIAYGIVGERVDGMDPLAVYTATAEAVARARAGEGPTLIESVTYRFAPHSTYDGRPVYRTNDEERHWRERDPLIRTRRYLEAAGLWSQDQEDALMAETRDEVEAGMVALERDANPDDALLIRHVYRRPPQILVRQAVEGATAEGRPAPDLEIATPEPASEPTGPTAEITMVEAIRAALDHGMAQDPRMVILGEDVAVEGGVFRVTSGLLDKYGEDRVIDTPLSENGIIGTAVGMAMAGLRPVPEIEFAGFIYIALDQIIGHAARIRWRSRGEQSMPMVIRVPGAGGHGGFEFHSDSPEALLVHATGLTVVAPATASDAKGLMASALEAEDPILFFEPIARYHLRETVSSESFRVPIGTAKICRSGGDITLVTYGTCVATCLEAAMMLEREGVSAEVVDLRTLYPWDRETVLESVAKTSRLVTVHEAPVTLGVGAEISATVATHALYDLEAPVFRIGHSDAPWHPSPTLEPLSLISPTRIVATVRRALDS